VGSRAAGERKRKQKGDCSPADFSKHHGLCVKPGRILYWTNVTRPLQGCSKLRRMPGKVKAKDTSGASKRHPPAAKSKSGRKPGATARRRAPGAVVLLSGGNPQIAKADGDAPVKAYIAAIPGWKRAIAKRLDALIVRNVPKVRKAVKWNSPMYGLDGRGWFVAFHVFTYYVKVTFFRGTSLRPVPPGGTAKEARWTDVHEDDFDEAQMASWVKQAAALPGWVTGRTP
jgi:hypothetical protein